MNVSLTGNGLELTEALRNYVEERFSKLERHSDNITKVHIVLSTENKRQTAEVSLHIAKAKDIHAESVSEDMYASIDDLANKVERLLVKQKEKALDAKRQPGAAPTPEVDAE